MIIKKVILENIKSYVYEEINLYQGINCILGLNGSGKSTIIESIGVALFNYSKGNLNQLLRYDEKKGRIVVNFIANDDREYIVERTIRNKGGSVKIIDAATDTELYSGVSDVYSFIKKILKVSKTKDFTQLFSEIIAVPQGQFVSAFLERPTIRKENFDRLFNLHIYKDLGFRLKDLYDRIQNEKVNILKEDIANINGQVSSLDIKKQKLEELISEIEKQSKILNTNTINLNDITKRKSSLEKIKESIVYNKNKLLILNEKINILNNNIIQDEASLQEAELALETINKVQNDYEKYQNNLKELEELEKQYQIFIDAEKKLKSLENDYNLENEKIVNINEINREKTKDIDSKQKEIQKINSELVLDNNRLNNLQSVFSASKQNHDIKIIELNELKKSYNQKFQNYQLLKVKFDNLFILDKEKESNLHNQIELLNIKLQDLQKVRKKINELEKEKAVIAANLQNAIKNSQISHDGNCPFFNTKCKNIDEESLTDYFNNLIIELNEKDRKLDDEIKNLELELNEEQEILTNLQRLNKTIEDNQKNQKLIIELEDTFNNYFADIKGVTIVDKFNNLEVQLNKMDQNIQELDNQINEDKNIIFNYRTKIDTLKFTIKSKEQLYSSYEKEITQLKNIIFTNREKLTVLNENILRIKEEIARLNEIINANNVKARIDELKVHNLELEESKNLYLANINKACDQEKLLNILNNHKQEKINLENEVIIISDEINNYENDYSEEELSNLETQENELIKMISFMQASIKEKTLQKVELENEIKTMEDLIKEKDIKQKQLQKYQNIIEFLKQTRSIYSSLPQKLSARYREYISHAATQIYQRIANEAVILELTEDYEVRLIDKDNNYKTIEQLSGGEQMSCALAIRLSMLKHLSGLDVYFLDEPTINLDFKRRERIAEIVIDVVNELSQLFVISHDDTFDNITNAIIKLQKRNNISKVI